jgi:hypothetical protein
MPPFVSQGKLSATDLLSWWFPAASMTDPWDDYFDQTARVIGGMGQPPAQPPPASFPLPTTLSQMAPLSQRPSMHSNGMPAGVRSLQPEQPRQAGPDINHLASLWALSAEPEEELLDEHAQAAVECLYDFIHAVARRDVDGAMELVTEDYHVLEEDREIDRLGLRHQIEALLDSLRDWSLALSLAEIPQPYLHPYGILIYAEIQVDAYHPQHDLRRSFVQRRLCVFEQQSSLRWLIAAMSPVQEPR